MSGISNKAKRHLTCLFCPKKNDKCKCDKFWKEIYKKNRDEILRIYHDSKKPQ